jgi:uncharacterized protein (TIGR02231 family)
MRCVSALIAGGLMVVAMPAAPALAADIEAQSKIDSVTVFPSGAEVRRLARVKVPSGSHTLVVPDLPRDAVAASIRVQGKATGALDLGSVDSRRLDVPRGDPEASASARRQIEMEIERLGDERAAISAEIEALEAQKTFLSNLLQLPARPVAPNAGAGRNEDWESILRLVSKELEPINKSILTVGMRIRDIDRRVKDARGRLAAESPARVERTEVKIAVAAAQAVEAEIAISYQIGNAGWQPLYDARLMTGTKTTAPKLTIARRAIITQRTSEAWDAVLLSLSTTRPAAGTAAPVLQTLTVDFPPDRPAPVAAARPAAPPPAFRTLRSGKGASEEEASRKADQPVERADATAQRAQVEAGAFQAVYSILGRQTVANTGEPKRVLIDEIDETAALSVRAVPRRDQRAFLYAKLVVPKATPWLPGQVALFRDGTFVGNGRLPQLSPGQEHDIGFGSDDRVQVKAVSLEEKRGEVGIISTSRTDTRNYRLTIKSNHEQQISFAMLDQSPVSANQDIKIEVTTRPQPTRRDIEGQRGVLVWEDRLGPGEEKAIEFGYRVSWPASKSIVYSR